MNKYELALVVSAKIEDDARTATVEKAKEYITRAGGNVTEVEEAGKKHMRSRRCQKLSIISSSSTLHLLFRQKLSAMSASWTMFFVS